MLHMRLAVTRFKARKPGKGEAVISMNAVPGLCRRKAPAENYTLDTWNLPGMDQSEPVQEQEESHNLTNARTPGNSGEKRWL